MAQSEVNIRPEKDKMALHRMIGDYFVSKEPHLHTSENQGGVNLFLIFILLWFAVSS